MRKYLPATLLLLLLSITAAAQTPAAPAPKLDIPKGMKQYFIGFLVKGPKYTPNMPEDERARLIRAGPQELLDAPGHDFLVGDPRLLQLGGGHARTLVRRRSEAHPRTTRSARRKV